MVLGLSLATFTTVHVLISLVGLVAGLIVLFGMVSDRQMPGWTALFLLTTVLTSVTGFFFPVTGILPSHVVGIISLCVLAFALVGIYAKHLAGSWRWIYVVSAVTALYLNSFVAVVQSFQKVSFLQPLAPTQAEPPFVIAQLAVMLFFAALGALALRRFHPPAAI